MALGYNRLDDIPVTFPQIMQNIMDAIEGFRKRVTDYSDKEHTKQKAWGWKCQNNRLQVNMNGLWAAPAKMPILPSNIATKLMVIKALSETSKHSK